MNDPTSIQLARVLAPLAKRMRTDRTARKGQAGSYWTDEPLTMERLTAHVNGGPARGLCPIREGESVTMVLCIDFDSHGGETPWSEMAAVAERVMAALEQRGLRPVPFRSSGGRGIHLICTWAAPQDAYSVRSLAAEALGACGLRDGAGGVVAGQAEVYPRQDAVGQGEFGNQFILPLAGKSVPLDPVLGLEPMAKADALGLVWPDSDPVPVRERPVREVAASAAPEEIAVVRAALMAIPNDGLLGAPDYFEWRNLCFAVHEATGGTEEGYEVFAEWSRQNPAHDEKFTRARVWDKVRDADHRTSGAITRGTLFHIASQFGHGAAPAPDADGFEDVTEQEVSVARAQGKQHAVATMAAQLDQRFEAKEHWKKAIQDAPDERSVLRDVLPKLVLDAMLGGTERGMLAEVLKTKLASLGSKVGVADCRRMLTPPRRERPKASEHWSDGWVYVTDEDSFYRIDSDELLSMQGFNARFNRELPPAEDGEFRRSASWVALEDMRVPTVTRRLYMPALTERFSIDGVECVNSFRHSSLPEAADAITPAGHAAIGRFEKHVLLLCGGREEVARILISWCAFQVQFPGRKVRWAPLIKGVEGDGKTLLGRLVACALGESNVKDVSPKVLGTDFTDWAYGACVGVLEEIKLTGHNRYDILNALKPYITNNRVEIHPKGRAPFNTVNTMNYIAFTNHSDALPLNDTDRRWMIVFTPFTHISELEKIVGERGVYFDQLYDDLSEHQGEIRRWLLDYSLDGAFRADGNAPRTDEKGSMVAMSVSPEEEAVLSVIKEGGRKITDRVLILSELASRIQEDYGALDMGLKDISRVLIKHGWLKVPDQIKWQGKAVRVWVRGVSASETARIREILDEAEVTHAGHGSSVDLF